MSALDVLLALDATATGQAQPRTSVRHRHLSPAPMVIVAYRMSGEAGAPLGVRYGTSEAADSVVVAPEPRNRAIRFREALNPLAGAVCNWLENYYLHDPNSDPDKPVCAQAPQILVANRATLEFVSAVLGRSLRYLKSTPEFPVPETTVQLGTHMTWFEQQSQVPGSCVLVAATDLLRRHFATGQSALEDEDLHVLINWIDPPDGMTGAEAARQAEADRDGGRLPAVGPTPDPLWDRRELEPRLDQFNLKRDRDDSAEAVEQFGQPLVQAVTDALTHGWQATWRAHRALAVLPAGETVATRWDADRWAWTSHVKRVQDGMAFFRTTDSVKQAAWALASFEEAQENLDIGETVDDPLVLAGLVASGEALLGQVVDADSAAQEQGPKRKVYRPWYKLRLSHPSAIPVGAKLAWMGNPHKSAVEVVAIEGTDVTVKFTKGMGRSAKSPGLLPSVGEQAAFAAVAKESPPRMRPPQDVPWTHIGADTPQFDSEVPGD